MRLRRLFVFYIISTAAAIGTPFAIHGVEMVRRWMMPVNSEAALESAPALHRAPTGAFQPIPVCSANDGREYYNDRDFAVGSDPSGRRSLISDIVVRYCSVSDDGTLYLEGGRFRETETWLRAYSGNGKLKWTVPIDEIYSPLALARDGTAYLISMPRSGNTVLTAYDADGSVKWHLALGGFEWDPVPPAIGPDGTIYVFSGGQSVIAITPQGQERWRASVPARVWELVVGADGRVFVNVPTGNLIAFDAQGHKLWSFYSGAKGGNGGVAVGGDGVVYFASGFLYALDSSGKAKWTFKSELTYTKDDYFDGDPVIAEDGTVYADSYYHQLCAITPNGRKKWVVGNQRPNLPGLALSTYSFLRTQSAWFSLSSGLATSGWPTANHDYRNSRSQEAQ
jgi:outer membrane protein assembly factor BamB